MTAQLCCCHEQQHTQHKDNNDTPHRQLVKGVTGYVIIARDEMGARRNGRATKWEFCYLSSPRRNGLRRKVAHPFRLFVCDLILLGHFQVSRVEIVG